MADTLEEDEDDYLSYQKALPYSMPMIGLPVKVGFRHADLEEGATTEKRKQDPATGHTGMNVAQQRTLSAKVFPRALACHQ